VIRTNHPAESAPWPNIQHAIGSYGDVQSKIFMKVRLWTISSYAIEKGRTVTEKCDQFTQPAEQQGTSARLRKKTNSH